MWPMRKPSSPMSLRPNSRTQLTNGKSGNAFEISEERLTRCRYGDYQQEPEEPTVGTAAYPEKLYNSWDPNWRGFIGTAFIVGLEEFGHLISPPVTALLLESLYNNTKGDEYRVGGVDGDNLYPAYTNPVSEMRRRTQINPLMKVVDHACIYCWMDRSSSE